jgi:hypothetical protein
MKAKLFTFIAAILIAVSIQANAQTVNSEIAKRKVLAQGLLLFESNVLWEAVSSKWRGRRDG